MTWIGKNGLFAQTCFLHYIFLLRLLYFASFFVIFCICLTICLVCCILSDFYATISIFI